MLPTTMRYITHGDGGGPEVLRLAEGALPAIGPREVLIQVHFAGLNRADLLQRAGKYPPPSGASPILGLEVAGRVAALGPEVTAWKVGDQVCALTPGGGYADFCRTDASHCLALPRGFDLVNAAAIPEAFFTVWTNLVDRGRLQQHWIPLRTCQRRNLRSEFGYLPRNRRDDDCARRAYRDLAARWARADRGRQRQRYHHYRDRRSVRSSYW